MPIIGYLLNGYLWSLNMYVITLLGFGVLLLPTTGFANKALLTQSEFQQKCKRSMNTTLHDLEVPDIPIIVHFKIAHGGVPETLTGTCV